MKAIKQNNKIIVGVPFKWKRLSSPDNYFHGYSKLTDEEHYADGWGEVLPKAPLQANERYGNIIHIEESNTFYYPVEAISEEEIKANIIQVAEQEKQIKIEAKKEYYILKSAQEITDPQECIDNKALYPFWETGIEIIENYKYQRMVGLEIKLYKALESHIAEKDLAPEEILSKFTEIVVP